VHEGQQRQRRSLLSQAQRGVPSSGEAEQRCSAETPSDLARGCRDRVAEDRVLTVFAGSPVRSASARTTLGSLDDARHRRHRVRRVLPDAGLGRQHDRVRPVEDGVGHVGDLGPGGTQVGDHRVEHLGGHDDGLGRLPAQPDGALLHHRNLFEGHLHTEVTTRNHQAVEGFDDGW
jgi:hypothetical protein